VAILAELVQLRATGALAAAGPAGTAAQVPAAEATDPVCGMTVAAGPSSYPLEHGGTTYYFCRAACRQEFSRDPAAYLKEARC
jgi:xanthine dehydrogenase accessory factor